MARPDPASLERLHDIVAAPPVSWWPPAPGWYLVSGFLVVALSWLGWRRYRRWRADAYRRAALKELKALSAQRENGEEIRKALASLPVLLKRTALAVWPRERVAGLSGRSWLEFLDATGNTRDFTEGPGRVLPDLAYTGSAMASSFTEERLDSLIQCAGRWIRRHKKLKNA